MKSKFYHIFAMMMLLWVVVPVTANNIQVSNVTLTGKNITDNYVMLQFDLSWENSWRVSTAPANWDAAWVFVKYRISTEQGGDNQWYHARLHNTGHIAGAGTGSAIDPGFQSPELAYHATTNPALGAFVYRSSDGIGPFSATGMQFRWNYGDNSVDDDAVVEIKVFAMEMVYVPEGNFYVGTGADPAESNSFTQANNTSGATLPFQITSTPPTIQGNDPSSLSSNLGARGGMDLTGTATASLASGFPTGFGAFYCMKYEISQQQYVDFLNTLNRAQQNSRTGTNLATGVTSVTNRNVMSNSSAISGRNGIRCDATIHTSGPITFYCDLNGNDTGGETGDGQWIACNYLSWMDGAAYGDWAGLRPMTELEFEKACRGTVAPVANEYAWGNTSATAANNITDPGASNETTNTSGANAVFENQSNVQGPMRVGVFATGSSTRVQSGASYWGVMELSGNLWERTVTIGNVAGRSFTGLHGNGELNSPGDADQNYWPGINGNNGATTSNGIYGGTIGVTHAAGSGFRGGSWSDAVTLLLVSPRFWAEFTFNGRSSNHGFRTVRVPSEPPGQPSAINGPVDPCSNSIGNVYSVTQMPGVTYTWTVPTGWSITGGLTTHAITVTAGTTAGDIEVTPENAYGTGPVRTLAVTTMTTPVAPAAGTHVPSEDQIVWNWNSVTGATGYKWNTTNNYATAIDKGSSTSHTETGLLCSPCGISYTRYVWAYNTCGSSAALTLNETATCPTSVVDVTSPTGRIWMDRNLGAVQVATSSTDALAYGDLYQWGRGSDGHQCRNSVTTPTLSASDQPGHGNYIEAPNTPRDWRSPQEDNLWQGVSGVNNPCPSGYRLPTYIELDNERLQWITNDAAGAFASPLKFTMAGRRNFNNGLFFTVGSYGYYWSSTILSTTSRYLYLESLFAGMSGGYRADGYSVRCIKN